VTVHVRRWLPVAMATVAVLGPIGALAPAAAVTKPTTEASGSDRTSATEARRVDSVPTPELTWLGCGDAAQCATVWLPLDYDEPNGAKTKVSLLRHPARDQAHRIGSLFLNPGGPGGSGIAWANYAPHYLSPALLDRFDVVGVDPRGVNLSEQVTCFTNTAQQTKALKGFDLGFPMGKVEERAFTASATSLGEGCSSTGRPLSGSMSTAEVARDMDVLRRAVGDSKLTFFGVSYGSYLGQVYANMFPDRVRAVTIDGVVDPIAWAGTPATASRPTFDRLRSADAASRALRQILTLCDRAGEQKCRFAAAGDPVANYDLLADRLKKTPVMLPDPAGGPPVKLTYAVMVSQTLGALYLPDGYAFLDEGLSDLMVLTAPPTPPTSPASTANRSKVMGAFVARLVAQDAAQKQAGLDLPYANTAWESRTSVVCTDESSSPDATSWPKAAAAADKRAKYFGRWWVWITAGCAGNAWTVRDEDAYRGTFNRRTASPILVVGNKWDPATSYEGALKAASLLPNSALLSSDNWGHTAYGTSACATSAIDTYLLTQVVPARGTTCHGDVQPFEDNPASGLRHTTPRGQRVPIVPLTAPRI
jgi:pimeloyl-ACP methyl ester carboxylesterase